MSTAKKGFVGGFCGCFGVLAAVIVLIIIVVVIIGVAAGGGGEKKAKVVATAPGQAGQAQASPPTGPVSQPIGSTQKVGDAEVTVHGVRESAGEQYFKPKTGMKWVIVDVSAKNVGDNAYNLSSLLQAKLRDVDARNYTITVGPQTVGDFDGTIAAGDTLRGEVAFEVPVDAKGLTFVFGQSFGSEQAFWAVQ
jgi:hypothetical protein